MFTLQKLNVVRIVTTEEQKSKLINQGFIEVVEDVESNSDKAFEKTEKVIESKSKTK